MTKNAHVPVPTPETAHFWEGTRQNELRLQKCRSCSEIYFPPRPFCPACSSQQVDVVRASGKGIIHTFIISNYRTPGFEPPYSIAVVELEEGPRILTNIVGCEQSSDAIRMEMPVKAAFEPLTDEITLVKFTPAGQP